MSTLTFPYAQGKPVGARFSDRGCLSCPPGTGLTKDSALDILERVTNQVLTQGFKDFAPPRFPLAGLPVKPPTNQYMSVNSRIKFSVGFPNVHKTRSYDPTPNPTAYNVTRELIDKCGGSLATAQLVSNANSIGCAPPLGTGGVMGKRRYYQQAFTQTMTLGPFCTTDYQERRDFADALMAYKGAAIRASAMALEYEKMRRFVDMSVRNCSAIAGQTRPRFSASGFDAIPSSPGGLEWMLNAIEMGLGAEVDHNVSITVTVSPQILKFWIEQYAAQHNVPLTTNFGDIRMATQGYVSSFEGGTFKMKSLKTAREVIFNTDFRPVYTEFYKTQAGAEWDFQPYFLLEQGDDPDTTQAEGFFQTFNPGYGDADAYRDCEGVDRKLCELIFIHVNAFEYQSFPTNPLGTSIAAGVETNLANLWGGTDIKWHFGLAAERYFLDPINKALEGTGAPCLNNRKNTWFAGEISNGLQIVELEPRQMMCVAVQVPFTDTKIGASEAIIPCSPPDAITVTSAPVDDPKVCVPIPTVTGPDDEDEGCFQAPARLQFNLPCDANRTVSVMMRRDPLNVVGALTVPFSVTEGTALEGTAGTDHFRLASGNLVFADGEETAQLDIILHPIAREDGDPAYVTADLVWDNDPAVVCGSEDATVVTKLCFKLCQQSAAADDSGCPTGGCDSCE